MCNTSKDTIHNLCQTTELAPPRMPCRKTDSGDRCACCRPREEEETGPGGVVKVTGTLGKCGSGRVSVTLPFRPGRHGNVEHCHHVTGLNHRNHTTRKTTVRRAHYTPHCRQTQRNSVINCVCNPSSNPIQRLRGTPNLRARTLYTALGFLHQLQESGFQTLARLRGARLHMNPPFFLPCKIKLFHDLCRRHRIQ